MLIWLITICSLQWRHNGRDSVSNHQPHDCLLNRLFRRRSKKTSKLRVTGLCAGNSPGTGEFPAQRASNAENVSIWWRHHAYDLLLNTMYYYNMLFSVASIYRICIHCIVQRIWLGGRSNNLSARHWYRHMERLHIGWPSAVVRPCVGRIYPKSCWGIPGSCVGPISSTSTQCSCFAIWRFCINTLRLPVLDSLIWMVIFTFWLQMHRTLLPRPQLIIPNH